MEFLPMKNFLGCAALALAIALMGVPADAKGCLKGAAVGRRRPRRRSPRLYWRGRRLRDRASRSEEEREKRKEQRQSAAVIVGRASAFYLHMIFSDLPSHAEA